MIKLKKPELLAPAGNMEKLKTAFFYGADAVYIGLKNYSLRARESEFEIDKIKKAVKEAHILNKRLYLAVNIFLLNKNINNIKAVLKKIKDFNIDALIVSDPSMLLLRDEICPKTNLHLSTQVNVNNWQTVNFWKKNGFKRINLARELNLKDIKEIREKTKAELEIFVHGAMCMAYSGRCNLSYYMANRSANKGLCAHPCRWEYHLIEKKRPSQKFLIEEDKKGSYIFNSKDLCMIENIPDMMSLGLDSWKIEGRMKTSFYLAVVIKAYREAIDTYCQNPNKYKFNKGWLDELKKISHRGYCSGFYMGELDNNSYNYDDSGYIQDYKFVGIVNKYDSINKKVWINVKNKIKKGDEITFVMPPGNKNIKIKILKIEDINGKILLEANNQGLVSIDIDEKIQSNIIVRMKEC